MMDFSSQFFVFRVDASLQMGVGHVMRCLTLADALKARGARSLFVCRTHHGNLIDFIVSRGHEVVGLPAQARANDMAPTEPHKSEPRHALWVGASWQLDAQQTIDALNGRHVDVLVVDHYGLDARWEARLRPLCSRLFAIDDLADRPHAVDMLLDQNLGRVAADYVDSKCRLLIGPRYVLLRPEFAAWRERGLARRSAPFIRQVLVSMGGVDAANATCKVLDALSFSALPHNCRLIVVMGSQAPWLEQVRVSAARLPWSVDVKVGVSNMAELMAASDLAIGAAGSTSWERCALGLPALMLVLADNQREAAAALEATHAARSVELDEHLPDTLRVFIDTCLSSPDALASMSHSAASIVDGLGVERVIAALAEHEGDTP
ncbi:UDP-2,4-diacetamido-2,4,6-trideoxy-beta-L-altropyranose hydrolase [Aquabacterium sp.]|uniref:UDP-2,4-diacetamido-2,4, 6-trideoxy-beta-L-altropyranose hydrolase n=1 Tax=Aquabacterium sp. TaxID=1872578 RepID=UPI002614803A|nr:UDP-2,4-diacetamido-2,4,6-trideoxy-beta-L-altropyranose hydrolase [Aquabacterium sp.]MDD2976745.1 UDP-2,4-diacetamido-2,4,6-trideoxy-beta-L-altropyranose hydrolase [Aquabacterium sp.]